MVAATLVATVVSAAGGTALIDRGLVDGLRVDDRGAAYYALAVGAVSRRIEIGAVRVSEVELATAEVELEGDGELRPGCQIELRVDLERLTRSGLLAAVRDYLERPSARAESASRHGAAPDPALEELLREALGEAGGAGAPSTDRAGMAKVAGGRHAIGLDLDEAGFFNQHPRFEVGLEPFWIDRRPRTRRLVEAGGETREVWATQLSWAEAAEVCREAGLRLPTEIEWEAAVRAGAVETGFPVLEWTASWYQPYPGNEFREAHYGERFRVLRGSLASSGWHVSERRYMAPEDRSRRVGFRCAGEAP